MNRIQSSYGKQQASFGMSQILNLKVLAKDPKITKEAAEAISNFAKNEAPKDGKDIVLMMRDASTTDINDFIRAGVNNTTNNPIINLLRRVLPPQIFNYNACIEYDRSNPVQSIKNLIVKAERIIADYKNKQTSLADKLSILRD